MSNGKRAILVEDSVVRGETLKKTIKLVKNAGAKEIHVRVTEAPVRCPCFYGIDMSTYSELLANKFNSNESEIAKYLGVDSFRYQKFQGLIDSIGISREDLCTACLNGEYPTEFGKTRSEELKTENEKFPIIKREEDVTDNIIVSSCGGKDG